MMMLQEAFVWLVPEQQMAKTLVDESGLISTFIDFSEPVYVRIKRILLEAVRRNMIVPLVETLLRWYPENRELKDAFYAWKVAENKRDAAYAVVLAARSVDNPIATAKVTRKDEQVVGVDVDVDIPALGKDVKPPKGGKVEKGTKIAKEPVETVEIVELVKAEQFNGEVASRYVGEPEPGDWFSSQRTISDHESRLATMETKMLELEEWRRLLSQFPSVATTPKEKK